MVAPHTVLKSIKEAIKSSGRLPNGATYAIFELDMDGGQANVRPPIVEIQTIDTIRSTSLNTDYVGPSTDDSGNEIGSIYRAGFQMPVQIDVWTAEGDSFDPRELGQAVRLALYQYETRQEDATLPDPDSSGTLAGVNRFEIGSGQPADDLTMTPALRRWRQEATVWFEEVIDTAVEYGEQPYVERVDGPADGEWTDGSTIDILFDATPSQESAADDFA